MRPARQVGQVGLLVPVLAASTLWWCGALSFSNVGPDAGKGKRLSSVQRRATATAWAFDLKDQPDVEIRDMGGAKRLWYQPVSAFPLYQTVVGEILPATGRHYWEVKILKKPVDAWECIGLIEEAELRRDMPLKDLKVLPGGKNKMFVAGSWDEVMAYRVVKSDPKWNKVVQQNIVDESENQKLKKVPSWWLFDRKHWRAKRQGKNPQFVGKTVKEILMTIGGQKEKEVKDRQAQHLDWNKFKEGSSALMGTQLYNFPTFVPGTVVGIDVNMDTVLWLAAGHVREACQRERSQDPTRHQPHREAAAASYPSRRCSAVHERVHFGRGENGLGTPYDARGLRDP